MLLKCGKRSSKNIFSHFLLQSKFWCFSALKFLLPFLSGLFFRIQFPVFLSRPAISRLLNHFSFPWIKSWKLFEGYIFILFEGYILDIFLLPFQLTMRHCCRSAPKTLVCSSLSPTQHQHHNSRSKQHHLMAKSTKCNFSCNKQMEKRNNYHMVKHTHSDGWVEDKNPRGRVKICGAGRKSA